MPDRAGRHAAVVILAGWCMIFAGVSLAAASTARAQEGGPTKHFSVDNPAELSDADAEDIYRRLTAPLRKGYGLSDHPVARAYQSWSRYNTAPYRSETHGERFVNNYANGSARAYGTFEEAGQLPFVNNYANGSARAYGTFEEAGQLPAGSVVAKDSFAVTAAGDVFAGPLFIMEKMSQGFNAASRDWRCVRRDQRAGFPQGSVLHHLSRTRRRRERSPVFPSGSLPLAR
jgi:hypothetical protein